MTASAPPLNTTDLSAFVAHGLEMEGSIACEGGNIVENTDHTVWECDRPAEWILFRTGPDEACGRCHSPAFFCTPCKERRLANSGVALYCPECHSYFYPPSTAYARCEPL